MTQFEKACEAAAALQSRLQTPPEIGIILGSGLDGIAQQIEGRREIPYGELPHFACSTAPGHRGQFAAGRWAGRQVLCMQGRLHVYEGHPMQAVVFPVRVMHRLGIKTLIVTNAAGAINPAFSAGEIMLITDHINLMGQNPLIGPNESDFGPRFCDMSYVYTPALQALARSAAQSLGLSLREGVYLGCTGPSYETPAEIRAFRALGADAVGMSTVPEAIAASHCGMRLLAFSLITNMAAGVLGQPLSEQEVLEIGARNGDALQRLIAAIVPGL